MEEGRLGTRGTSADAKDLREQENKVENAIKSCKEETNVKKVGILILRQPTCAPNGIELRPHGRKITRSK
jgi:hypothetical protein